MLVPLDGQAVRIGRDLSADLHLRDPSVSRRHAIRTASDAVHRILDGRSFNGTVVNGRTFPHPGGGAPRMPLSEAWAFL